MLKHCHLHFALCADNLNTSRGLQNILRDIKIGMRESLVISTAHHILWGNLRLRDHLEDPGVDGRIILRWIFRKWEGVVGAGWSWLRIGTAGGHL